LKVVNKLMGKENVSATSLQRLCDDRFAASELYNKLINIYPDLGAAK
jgi:phage/plasmid-associated DNA primase